MGRRARVLGDRDQRRSEHTVAEAVAAAQLLDDLAAGATRARDVRDALVLARVERCAGRGIDRRHALALEELAELAVDGRDALDPRLVDAGFGTVLDREVEIVGEREHLANERLGGEAEHGLPLLGRAALEVEELGALALQRGEVVVALANCVVEGRALGRTAAVAAGLALGRAAGLELGPLLASQLGLAP